MVSAKAVDSDVLWIDLRGGRKTSGSGVDDRYHRFAFSSYREMELFAVLERQAYKVFVFQYDSPTSATLRLLEKAKADYPSCPVIMLTEQHSEALAVWALRSRIWDYFVEPVEIGDIDRAIQDALAIKNNTACNRAGDRKKVARISARPSNVGPKRRDDLAARARTYVEQNYQRELTLKEVAEHLSVSYSYLSRQLKQQCQCSFSVRLWNARIGAAKVLLLDADASVTTVCYEVGCSDPGYFATKFRTKTNMSPSEYRGFAMMTKGESPVAV